MQFDDNIMHYQSIVNINFINSIPKNKMNCKTRPCCEYIHNCTHFSDIKKHYLSKFSVKNMHTIGRIDLK